MAYSTQADLQQACGGLARLTQLTDWNGTLRAPDPAVIATAIANGDSVIDSYLNKQFRVPLAAPIPSDIVRVSARMARFDLMDARGLLDERVLESRDRDIKWLEGVRDGLISIGEDAEPAPSSMRFDSSTERPTSKDVSRRKLFGFS